MIVLCGNFSDSEINARKSSVPNLHPLAFEYGRIARAVHRFYFQTPRFPQTLSEQRKCRSGREHAHGLAAEFQKVSAIEKPLPVYLAPVMFQRARRNFLLQFCVTVKIFCQARDRHGKNTRARKNERNGRLLHEISVSFLVFDPEKGIGGGEKPAQREREKKKSRRCENVGFHTSFGYGYEANENSAENFQKIGTPYGNVQKRETNRLRRAHRSRQKQPPDADAGARNF